MQNLLNSLKDVLNCCSVMQGDQFDQFFMNIKFTVTGPDVDCELYYSSDANGLINSNRKMFKP